MSVAPEQNRFDGWAIVDVLGHQRYVGYVTTETYGQVVMFRIDVPRLDARERVTVKPEYIDGTFMTVGTIVQEDAVEGYTKLIGAGSIYSITPCTEEAALAAVEAVQPRPLMSAQLPPKRTLPGLTDGDMAAITRTSDEGDEGDDKPF